MNQKNTGQSSLLTSTLANLSLTTLRFVGLLLLVYLLAVVAYGYYHFEGTRSRLLTYGLTSATASLIATAVLLIAFSVPAFSIFRILSARGRPSDYAFALVLPVISWLTSFIPANYDATSGKALRFCAERPDATRFCLDYEGIDPLTRKKLMPLDEATAELDFRRQRGLVPKLVLEDAASIMFFDPLTGKAKVFFARNAGGCFDVFDNPGVDPMTSEKLVPVTKDLIRQLVACRLSNSARLQPRMLPESILDVSPSFNCEKAKWKSERIICASQPLSVLDLSMGNAYRDAVARSPTKAVELRNSQNYWLRTTRESCDDGPCLERLYEERILELGRL